MNQKHLPIIFLIKIIHLLFLFSLNMSHFLHLCICVNVEIHYFNLDVVRFLLTITQLSTNYKLEICDLQNISSYVMYSCFHRITVIGIYTYHKYISPFCWCRFYFYTILRQNLFYTYYINYLLLWHNYYFMILCMVVRFILIFVMLY